MASIIAVLTRRQQLSIDSDDKVGRGNIEISSKEQ